MSSGNFSQFRQGMPSNGTGPHGPVVDAFHQLYYDGNGQPGTAVEIAHFTNNVKLANTDIVAVGHKLVG